MGELAEKSIGLKHITVRGVVQGVGFRPFVFRLAKKHHLKGAVINRSSGVEIEVEGERADLGRFLDSLRTQAPPLARIQRLTVSEAAPRGYTAFEIRESRPDAGYQLISPDIATCADCRREIFDPDDKRYRYPFTNCTNCGPRFTIIDDIPYDRPNTTMAGFTMCDSCRAEYEDPFNRRFHAQPNACPVCGPRVWLEDGLGTQVSAPDVLREAAYVLRQGFILAVKGLGGFQLACDATNSDTIASLRKRKGRPDKPFAVMMKDLNQVREHCEVSTVEEELLRGPEAPVVLLEWKNASRLSRTLAPGNRYLGVMLPYTPLHHLLLHDFAGVLVMTSGNMTEEPIARDNDEAKTRLGELADYFLFHDRAIRSRYDDSVALVFDGRAQEIRRARSYAPYPVKLPFSTVELLATGAFEKNTFCLARDDFAFVSQHIGDLENVETLDHYEETLDLYKRLFRIEPKLIAHDLHPDYLSTRYAMRFKDRLPLTGVQHHHAHIAACMADNHHKNGRVIGVAFDGSGFGPDGTVWGGEFLVADYRDYSRAGHLEKMPLPGGEAAVRRPYRIALSYLYTLFDQRPEAASFPYVCPEEEEMIVQQLRKRVNSPLTSSCGRLFDAVSALLGVCNVITFEGQAAIALEMAARGNAKNRYPFNVEKVDGIRIIRIRDMISAILMDMSKGTSVGDISIRFHTTVAWMIASTVEGIAEETGRTTVALSGGCFQNRLLLSLTVPMLEGKGFKVLLHKQVPCNDGGISLGQAAVAASKTQ